MKYIEAIFILLKNFNGTSALIVTVVTFFISMFFQPVNLFVSWVAPILSITFPAIIPAVTDGYGFVNYFVPLDQVLDFAVLYFPLWLLARALRILKSLIPFIAT